MCTYNGLKIVQENFISLQEIEIAIAEDQREWLNRPIQSGFDYGTWPVLKSCENENEADLSLMEWGYLPNYLKTTDDVQKFRYGYKDASGYHPPMTTLNAIGEEMLDKATFRQAALQKRCLVLSSHFYEWRHLAKIGKKGQPLKATEAYPYKIFMPEHSYFFMAGIWNCWTDKQTGETKESFAIVTTAANKLMEQIHNKKKRMPLIFNEASAKKWISHDLSENEVGDLAKFNIGEDTLVAYTLHKDFRNRPNPEEPFTYEVLPALTF